MKYYLKKTTILLAIVLCYSGVNAQHQVIGKWLSSDKRGVTQIFEKDGKYFGKIIELRNACDEEGCPLTDTRNPDPALRNEPLMGLIVMKDFSYKNKNWTGGTIYEPRTGRTYPCSMWLTDKNTLQVRGSWGIFYQTRTWTRAK